MAAALLPNPLWDLVEPFLPAPPNRPKGGRPRVSDRACLTGILFVLRSGIPWQMLPQELGCGSGMTCWRRLRDWQGAGVWNLIHFALLDWLARSDQLDWSRAVVDSCSIRAVFGGDQTGPNPTDRAKRGSKRHLICDGRGVPLAIRLTGANRNTRKKPWRSWMPFLRYTAHAGDRGSGRNACSEIAVTTRRRFAAVFGLATSCPC
jgi:transposase